MMRSNGNSCINDTSDNIFDLGMMLTKVIVDVFVFIFATLIYTTRAKK